MQSLSVVPAVFGLCRNRQSEPFGGLFIVRPQIRTAVTCRLSPIALASHCNLGTLPHSRNRGELAARRTGPSMCETRQPPRSRLVGYNTMRRTSAVGRSNGSPLFVPSSDTPCGPDMRQPRVRPRDENTAAAIALGLDHVVFRLRFGQ